MTIPLDLHVQVARTPEPGLLRPAIMAALAGRSWPDGPESTIARAVAETLHASTTTAFRTATAPSSADALPSPDGEGPC
jgi:hypothetical protein